MLVPLLLVASLFPGTRAAFAAGYSAGLSAPTPPTPSSTFVWTVSGSSPTGTHQIDTVFLSGCWNAGQIKGAVASHGMVSINKTGTISVANLTDAKLPLTVTVTFVAVYQSRNSISTLAYKAGPTTTPLSVAGPNCQGPVDVSLTNTAASTRDSGTSLTYTLGYANASAVAAENVKVTDPLPAGTTFVSATGGVTPDSTGTLNWNLGTLAATATGTLTVTVTVTATSGTITNTATIATTSGELNTTNNTASASTTVTLRADLSISASDGVTTAIPGTTTTYTIVVTNNGPSVASNASVVDTLPSQFINATWMCTPSGGGSCGAGSGSGSINTTVTLPSGATATFSLTASIDPAATGTLTNSASVSAPSGEIDPNTSNNTASDSDTLTPQADLSITKSDATATAVPGGSTTYTIVVTNSGPSAVSGASVTDTLPAGITGASWTCAASAGGACAAASGTGSINTTVTLAPAATATFTMTAALDPSAIGSLANAATVAAPAGVADPNPNNNTATDTDSLTPQADLGVSVTDGVSSAVPGTTTTYTITVTNNGPSVVAGATVADTLPGNLSNASWTCTTSTPGDSCATGSGTGDIAVKVTLGPGDAAVFSLSAGIASSATGTLSNTASVASPAGTTDPNSANNVSTDTDTLTPQVDLAVTVDDGSTTAIPGTSVSYKVSVTNAGPSDVTGASLSMTSAGLLNPTLVCDASGTVSGLTASDNIAAGGVSVCTLTGEIDPAATGSFTLQGTISPPTGVTDTNTSNNTASDTDTLTPQADVSIAKTSSVSSAVAGSSVSYQIVVGNAGPSAAPGVGVTDTLPAQLTGATWTCSASTGAQCASASGTGSISAAVDLAPGASATFTLSATIDASFSGPLGNTASVTMPAGVTDPTPGDDNSTATVSVTSANDFSINASPSSVSIAQGSSGSSTISTAVTAGSAQTVSLSVSGVPSGATATLSPTSVAAGQSSTLSVSTGTAAAGMYTLTVTGTGASGSHATTVSLTVLASAPTNDFSINAGPSSVSIAQGGSGSSTISTAVTAGSAQTISLSASGAPSGVTATLSPTSVSSGQASTLTISAASSAAVGTFTITVTGSAASGSHSTTISLRVTGSSGGSGITNGGFETGSLSGWTASGASETVISSGCHGGTYCAELGSSSPTNGDSTISQTFTAPSGATGLSLWWKETCPDTVTYDWALATLTDSTAGTTATLVGKTCTTNAWTNVTASVTAGHSYTLTLTSHDDNYASDPTFTLFDDVTLTLSAPPPSGGITNGGFESGTTGWTTSGTTSIATSGCHGGTHCAQAGSTSPTNGDSSFTQTFTVPSGKSQLSVWYKISCPDTVTYDWATVTLNGTAIVPKTCTSSGSWTNITAAVTTGQSYRLTLTSHDDNYAGDPTYTLFDDVTLN